MPKFYKIEILFVVVLFLQGCNQTENIDANKIFQRSTIEDSLSFYFPPTFNDTVKHKRAMYDNFKQKWYSSALYSFKVPILYNKTDSQTTYRLLWLRSFHPPVCFSVKEYKNNYYFNARVLDKQPSFYLSLRSSGYINGKEIIDTVKKNDRLAFIVFDTTIRLDNNRWDEISKYLSIINFWNGPIHDPNGFPEADGASWIFEGRKNNSYHFIERSNMEGDLKEFGKYLIKISGLKIKDEDIY